MMIDSQLVLRQSTCSPLDLLVCALTCRQTKQVNPRPNESVEKLDLKRLRNLQSCQSRAERSNEGADTLVACRKQRAAD